MGMIRRSRGVTITVLTMLVFGWAAMPAGAFTRPDPLSTQWGNCAAPSDTFCVESATINGDDMLSGPASSIDGHPLNVVVNFLDDNSINWAVRSDLPDGALPAASAGALFDITLRIGDLEPNYTIAYADRMRMVRGGDAAGGYTLQIMATQADIHWNFGVAGGCFPGSCGDDTTAADIEHPVLSGNTQNMALWDPAEKTRFAGTYIATNAQSASPAPVYGSYPAPQWYLYLANPHLQLDGLTPATGSFTAWLPPSYFTEMGIGATAESAVDAGFHVTRTDGAGAPVDVAGSADLVDGGAYLRIDDLHYSSPQLTVSAGSGSPAAAAPFPPLVTAATPTAGGITLHVTPPFFTGGSAVSSYIATCTQGATTRTKSSTSTTITITHLVATESATCSVRAENTAGTSDASNVRSATPLTPNLPSAPRSLAASYRSGKVRVSFAVPGDDGGAPISGYRVIVCKAGKPCSGANVKINKVVTSRTPNFSKVLAAGSWKVTVAAINLRGAGPAASKTFTVR